MHLSSLDVNHGFNLYPFNINFQVIPGYDYALDMTPTESGEFRIVCNEFCGVGHHVMVGRIEVLPPADAPDGSGGAE
jgi:cytochrome c oxidase subunit 2